MADAKTKMYYPCCSLSMKIVDGSEDLLPVRVMVEKGTNKASIPTSVELIFDKIKRLKLDKGHKIADEKLKELIKAKLDKMVAARLAASSRADFVVLTQGAEAAVTSVELDNLSKQVAKQRADADAVIAVKDAELAKVKAELAKKK